MAKTKRLDSIGIGRKALNSGQWEKAKGAFEQAIREEPCAEAFEGLAMSAWWVGAPSLIFSNREKAYELYRHSGDDVGAARMAIWLEWDYNSMKGQGAVANGWQQRAHRLLDFHEPVPEYCWLNIRHALLSLFRDNDPVASRTFADAAIQTARSLGNLDLELMALSVEGLALVSEGNVARGMSILDEVAASIVGGEVKDLVVVVHAICYVVTACERVRDFERAAQWCEQATELAQRWNVSTLYAVCRTQYADMLMWWGRWKEAESELLAASVNLEKNRLGMNSLAIVRLAELRSHQGRTEEAETLFEKVKDQQGARLGIAELSLDHGDGRAALDLIERYLRNTPVYNVTARSAGLELLIRTKAFLNENSGIPEALAELRAIAETIGTVPLRASLKFAEGTMAATNNDHEAARCFLEDAADLFEQSSAPFEAARVRIMLAQSLRELNRKDIAVVEANHALESFQKVGASAEVERAKQLLQRLTLKAHPPEIPELAPLTERECEVLQYIAKGLSNFEIGQKLFISEHTVHRHVSNILAKLDLPSRTAAATLAVRHGLL